MQNLWRKKDLLAQKHRRTLQLNYHPQANGMVEQCNGTLVLLVMLEAVASEQQDDSDDQLPGLLSAYGSTPHSSMGMSPYRMLFGVHAFGLGH